METVSTISSHGGVQGVYKQQSESTGTEMKFSVFVPDHPPGKKLPVLWYLSGLTCTHANVTEKGEYRAACAEHGIVFIAPDTSPRGDDVPDAADEYDFGQGVGFYVDATQQPWSKHFRMRSYIEIELPRLIAENFPVDMDRQGITGHSMGGHGALTIALRNPGRFRAVSAFSPIVAPSRVPWGEKALERYLGDDRSDWRGYDAVALIEDGARLPDLLVDQGTADDFLDEQLKIHLLRDAIQGAGMQSTIRLHEGYDHSYYFISTFMAEHAAGIIERYGQIQILINSAGTTRPIPHDDLDGLDDALLETILLSNVRGPFSAIRAFAPALKASGDAVIVNISSISGFTGSGSNVGYCASKGALDTMTMSLARALGPEIRVLCVPVSSAFQALMTDRSAKMPRSRIYSSPSKVLVSLPSATRVPTPVFVKKPGMPAPPARMRSARVPWGQNSTSSSPDRYWRSNSLFSPT